MKGVVIEKGEKYFTFLRKIFSEINNIQKDYNWLITGHECYPQNMEYAEKLSGEYCLLTGDELTEMVRCEDFQWIWGTLSAFPKDIQKEMILGSDLPRAEGYERIWQNPICIQHPLAEIEIIAWDSSMTLIICKDDSLIKLLRENNTFAVDLEEYNK